MARYLLKRLIYAVLVLFAVSLITFFMSTLAPGDLVQAHLSLEGTQLAYQQASYSERAKAYNQYATRLGYDLPGFYVSLHPACFPDTLYRVIHKEERQILQRLLYRHGNWPRVEDFRKKTLDLLIQLESQASDTSLPWTASVRSDVEFLLTSSDTGRMHYLLNSITQGIPANAGDLTIRVQELNRSYAQLQQTHTNILHILPSFTWYGIPNQYHHWITKTLRGDLGRSLIDGRPVSTKIREALRWTLNINIIAILLAFGISIPLGVALARRVGQWIDNAVTTLFFVFFAIPSFWLAMICIVFLTTSEYGTWLDWFPTGGVGMVTERMSMGEKISIRISHLVLPVFCVLAGSLAYLTRQMRGSMIRELRQDYIRMARAKGLSESVVHWRHAFRNALFPMITMVGSAFPAAISGSVIIEVIFSIPGMGRLLYMSILARDWPVVYAMVLLAACLTIIGYLIADFLYRWANPRVELQT